jgi:iron complex outermembrane receptor protein
VKFVGFKPESLFSPDPQVAQAAAGVIGDVLLESGLAPIPQNIPAGIGILNSFASGSLYQTGSAQDTLPNAGDFWNANLTLAWRLSEAVTLKSITGYVSTERTGQLDLDATPFQLITVGDFTDSRAWSEELQAAFKAGPLDGVAGAYYFDETGEDATFAAPLPLLSQFEGMPPLVVFDGVADNRSWALYGQANWHASDRLTITGGLRYTWDSKGLRSFNHTGFTQDRRLVVPTDPLTGLSTDPNAQCLIALDFQNVGPGRCEARLVNDYSALTWTGSASYQVTGDLLAYVKASRGYRGGGENLRGGSVSFAPFGPEYATQYEVGVKSTFWDRRAQLNAAAYYTDYSDIQITNIVTVVVNDNPITGTEILNAGKAHLGGIEVEGSVIPIERLTLGLVADWFHGKYTRYTYAGVDETTQPWGTPAYTVDILARYEIPLAFGSLTAQADYDWRDRAALSLGDITDCIPVGQTCVYDAARQVVWGPTVGLLSARLTLHLDAWNTDVSLWGRNLANDRYFLTQLGAIDTRIFNVGFVSDPLTFGVDLRKGF